MAASSLPTEGCNFACLDAWVRFLKETINTCPVIRPKARRRTHPIGRRPDGSLPGPLGVYQALSNRARG
jgi:hypothetical protein